jgi:hypothetical protein
MNVQHCFNPIVKVLDVFYSTITFLRCIYRKIIKTSSILPVTCVFVCLFRISFTYRVIIFKNILNL